MSIYVWDSTNTKRQVLGTKISVRQNNAWVTPTVVKVRSSGTWVPVAYLSDPRTYTFNAAKVDTFSTREDKNPPVTWVSGFEFDDFASVGTFNGHSGDGSKDYVGTIGDFRTSSDQTLQSVLGAEDRKVIKSAKLYMKRSGGWGTSDAHGTIYTCMYKGTVGDSSPSYSKLEYGTDYRGSRSFSKDNGFLNINDTFSVAVAVRTIEGLRDNGYSISLLDRVSNVGTYRETWDPMMSKMYGPNTGSPSGYKPTLVVTVDYL